MNHSIYSADRSTHLKIVVVALVAGIAVAGLGISARSNSDDGYTQTARVIKAGKPVAITSYGHIDGSLTGVLRNSRGSLPAPKVAAWICRRPQLPPSRLLGKRPLPTGVFFLCPRSARPRGRRGGTVSISLPV